MSVLTHHDDVTIVEVRGLMNVQVTLQASRIPEMVAVRNGGVRSLVIRQEGSTLHLEGGLTVDQINQAANVNPKYQVKFGSIQGAVIGDNVKMINNFSSRSETIHGSGAPGLTLYIGPNVTIKADEVSMPALNGKGFAIESL